MYHVDTNAVDLGWHDVEGMSDKVYYFDSSRTDYTAAQKEEIYTALWTGWEDTDRWKPSAIIPNMNRFDDPLGAANGEVTVTSLAISGEYKTEYLLGDEFDKTGIVVTATYSDNTTKDVTDETEFTGFDSSTPGQNKVTAVYGGAFVEFTVIIKAPEGTINVKLSILGDTLHEGEEVVHTLAAGNLTTWVAETTYTVDSNATVWNLLLQAFEANSITYTYRMSLGTEYIDSVTYNGVTLREKDNNPNSGWQYTINGQDSTNGVNQQYLAEGDVICFHWTDDYTQEDYGGQNDDQQAAFAVEDLIDAIGTPVTLESENAITAARTAYDALTDVQKGLVSNYDKLTAAEARLAELKAERDQQAAQAVIDMIAAIGDVTIEDEEAIAAARAAYDALTPEQQALVTNLDVLTAAETAIAPLIDERETQAAGAAAALIEAIPAEVTLEDEAAIIAAREAYDALTEAQKAKVTDYDKLLAAEAALAKLKFGTLKPVVKAAVDKKTGKIKLTIEPVEGAVSYKILVATAADGEYTLAKEGTELTYTHTGKAGAKYFFKVVAVNEAGTESAESDPVNKFQVPAQVTSLKATTKKGQVTLKWKKVTGAKKYVIYMSKNGKTGWKKIGTVTKNTFVYKKGTVGKKLYFKVQALTANNKKGEFSKVVSIKVKK